MLILLQIGLYKSKWAFIHNVMKLTKNKQTKKGLVDDFHIA